MLFQEVGFLERFDAAAEAGFSAVEFWSPYEYDQEQIAEKLHASDLTLALYNLPAGDWDGGERGIACLPDRVGEFQEGVGEAMEYAKALGCEQVNCLAGIAPAGIDEDTLRDTLASNLGFAAAKLGDHGIRLLVEPINTIDIPGFYLNHTEQALSLRKDLDSTNVWLQYDIYHMQIMEGDLARTIESNRDTIRHIQIADNPGRNEPGTGEINYPFLFDRLDKLGYEGWVGCEYKPRAGTTDGLHWASAYLSPRQAARA